MDSFNNTLLSSTSSHKNLTSEKIIDARLEPPVLTQNPEDYLVSAPLLIDQEGTDSNLNGGGRCELTVLPVPPVAGPDIVPSNPTVSAPSSSVADSQLFSGSHQLNQLPTSQAHETLVSTTAYAGFESLQGPGHQLLLPRFRARRGQATDPHSLAERHRREKISDRIKNLHDLIPNSNKTDKAAMLDAIINYIKFLQLRIKDPNGISSSAPVGSSASVLPDGITDQESKKKALCLMPTELASAISTQKGKSTEAIPTLRQNLYPIFNIAYFLNSDGRGK